MGLIYSSTESNELINALSTNLSSGKESVDRLESGSQKVILAVDGQTLSGAAYTAGAGLFSELILPTITRVTNAVDKIEQELQEYITADILISSEIYLDEDKLNLEITIKTVMKLSIDATASFVREQIEINPLASLLDALLNFQEDLERLSESIQQDIDELNEKLQKLQNFASQTSNLFSTSLSDMNLSMQGVLVLNNITVNTDGTFTFPEGTDKSWFTDIKDEAQLEKLEELEEKTAYIQLLQDQFGLDEETAKQIYKVKEGLDERYPDLSQEKRDYLFARILGEITYGQGMKNQLMWPNTAGSLGAYFYVENMAGEGRRPMSLREILIELGLSEQEYNELYYNLNLQHQLSPETRTTADFSDAELEVLLSEYKKVYGDIGKDDFIKFFDEKLESYRGKGDFTHQSITTATILDENIRLANMSGIITGSFSSETVDELAGWRGDTTKVPAENPSIGNDDYKADLDAVNITQRMADKNISYAQASAEYYNDLATGNANRATEFKNNSGYDYVKNEILKDLAPKYEYTFEGKTVQSHVQMTDTGYIERELTEQEKMNYLKEKYPASYNFIESLKNNENEYTDYANKG